METNKFNIESLIFSFLQGNLTREEIIYLMEWIQQSETNKKQFMQYKNLWESSNNLPVSTDKALAKVLKQLNIQKRKFTYRDVWYQAAAVLLLPLLVSTLWLSVGKIQNRSHTEAQQTMISAPFGSFATFKLPDGSKVWLNSGSSIEYPNKFQKNKRAVHLIGEGYFEVVSDKESPFYVNTANFNVKATGTRFNVMAYPTDLNPSVSLVEGKVAVIKDDNNGNQVVLSSLKPNEHLIYHIQNGKVNIHKEDTYKHIAWKDGKLVFRNDLLSDVVKKISRQYNIDIEVVDDSIKQYRFRASFENEPLNELLHLLKLSSPIDYTEIEPIPIGDGTFSKRKILIYAANK